MNATVLNLHQVFRTMFFVLVTGCVAILGCTSYKTFVTVPPRSDVPPTATEFVVESSMTDVLAQLKANNILYNANESGAQTEEILLTEGIKARYNLYEFGTETKVVPFYAYTEKVRSNAMIMGGSTSASMINTDFTRMTYSKGPKMVFDYAVQICTPAGKIKYR